MNRRTHLSLACALFLSLLAASCGRETAPTATSGGKLRVLTSFLPIQAHVSAIAGDLAEVEQLLAKDTGPHDFQFAPSDVKRLAEADLFFVNGVGLEEWSADLIAAAAKPGLVTVDLSAGLDLAANPAPFAGAGHADNEEHSHHGHDGQNPHTWLDPVLAIQQCATILAALQKADPPHAAAYATNAAAYTAKLEALDADYRATLAPLPNKNLVTFHDAFPYLASRYGLNYIGAISEFPEKDPPPQQLADLMTAIREAKVAVLFAESDYAPNLLEAVAKETDAKVSTLDTLEVGLGSPDAYLERMEKNLASLKKAFAQ